MAKNVSGETVNFEKELSRLEEIVGKLEAGSLGLDESIALYEEGARCLKACQGRLAQAEAKIKMLVEGAEEPETRDFYVAEAEEEKPKAAPAEAEAEGGEAAGDEDASAKPRRRTKEPKGRGLF
jgi:exodeoxyribonuclease VII small subunit